MLWFNKQGAILSLTILQTGHFLSFFYLPFELVNKNAMKETLLKETSLKRKTYKLKNGSRQLQDHV